MAQFKVSSEALNGVSAQLTSGAGELQSRLASLRARVDGLGSEWEGSGSAAFADLYNEFNRAGNDLNDALTGIATMLGKAAGIYAESEASVAAAFRGA